MKQAIHPAATLVIAFRSQSNARAARVAEMGRRVLTLGQLIMLRK